MESSTIVDGVTKILADEFEVEAGKITANANLFTDLGLDSLDGVDLAIELEREFGFKVDRAVDEKTLRALRTVEDVCVFVRSKTNGQA